MGTVKLADLGVFLAGRGFDNDVDGDGQMAVSAVNTLEEAGPGELSFLTNPKYAHLLSRTKASAVIVQRDAVMPNGLAALRCDEPYAALSAAIIHIHGYRRHPCWGIHASASIAADARIGEGASIGPSVTIRENVVIGQKATVYPGCYIADHVTIGDDVTLFPNVVIYDGTRIGHRVTIHAGTVIGEDGLGYAPLDGKWLKIPQVGHVEVEDDVEIGACCAVDRATVGVTRIGRGTKFSNCVVVGHGCRIGDDCLIVAQVGLAGSTTLGRNVVLAGQVGVSGHVTIGDGARVGAKSGVHTNISAGVEYLGSPAIEINAFRRQNSLVRQLPKLKQRLRDLEGEVANLRGRLQTDDDKNA